MTFRIHTRDHTKRKRTCGAVVLTASLTGALFAPVAGAQDAGFACDPGFYQVISGQLAELDPNNGAYKTVGADYSTYNALGYRVADGLMYGMAGNKLQKVDANGTKTDLGSLDMPSGAYAGDFGDDGLLHVSRGGRDWHKIDVDTMTATPVPELSRYLAVADITNIHGKFYGVSSDGTLVVYDPAALTVREIAAVAGLPESLKSYGAAWGTAGGNLYVGRNSGEIYQVTGYTTDNPVATQVGSAPATNSNDGASCALAAPPAGLDDVDGPASESEPSTPAAQAAADSYEDNYDEIAKGFSPAQPQPETRPDNAPAEAESSESYAVEDAGLGEGAACTPGADEDRPERDQLVVQGPVDAPTTLYATGFDGNTITDFTIMSGRWTESDGVLSQHHTCGHDYSAVLDAFVVEDFAWEATFHGISGTNHGGLIFNQSSTKSRSGAMVVDLADGGATLRWGSYNNSGYYQNIGSIPVTVPTGQQPVTLAVEVHGTNVEIFLNGVSVAATTAPHSGGMVGLVASLADVSFDSSQLTALPTSTKTAAVEAEAI